MILGLASAHPEPRHHEADDSAARQFKDQLVVPEPLSTLYEPEVPEEATLAAAHSRQSYVSKTRHHAKHVRPSPEVNSLAG